MRDYCYCKTYEQSCRSHLVGELFDTLSSYLIALCASESVAQLDAVRLKDLMSCQFIHPHYPRNGQTHLLQENI